MSKSLGTKNLLREALNSNVGVIVVKVHNVIGRDQNDRKLVGTLIKHATLGLPITLNHPNRVRDFVWVDDFAKALWKIVDNFELLSQKQFPPSNEYLVVRQLDWEIGTGIGTKISDLAFEIYERLGHSKDLVDYETFEKEIDPYEVCVASTSNDRTIRCASNLRYILDTILGEKL
jgi:nucleoside-diphosphate-sugar epimerase